MSRDASQLHSLVFQMNELKMEATRKKVMNQQLEQEYLIVPSAERFAFLHSFLKTHLTKKVIVFFTDDKSLRFHSVLLKRVNVKFHVPSWQEKFFSIGNFHESEKGIFLSTIHHVCDLDHISSVDWIVHYDPLSKDYIDRVIGKAACGEEMKTKNLIFLIPQEIKFLPFFEEHNVKMNEFKCSEEMLANVKSFKENLETKKFYRHRSAEGAFISYVRTYIYHRLKIVYNVHHLDLPVVGASFGLSDPPKVNFEGLDINGAPKSWKRRAEIVETRQKRFSPYAR